MDYLAVDFGTANCVAADISGDGKLRLIPLESEEALLPSVLFVPRIGPKNRSVSSERVAEAGKERYRRALETYQLQLKRNEERLATFVISRGPKKPKEPLRNDYLYEKFFREAFAHYQREFETYEKSLRHFRATAGAEYAEKLKHEAHQLPNLETCEHLALRELLRETTEENFKNFFDQTFFKVLKEEGHPPSQFGKRALASYSETALGGFLLRSPKAFLGIDLHYEHQEIFVIAITEILRYIRSRAEEYTGKKFLGVVFGRPITYAGSRNDSGNAQALDIMRRSAQRSGFIEVRFVKEPLAAALAVARTILDTEDPALIVDLGGGTTDCACLSVDRNASESFQVLSASGERIGGADFDEALSWLLFSECLGKGAKLPKRNNLTFPAGFISDALATRDLAAQTRFRRSGDEILSYLDASNRDERIERLYQVYRDQLQHRLLALAEEVKIKLNTESAIVLPLDFFDFNLSLEFSSANLSSELRSIVLKVCAVARECVESANLSSTPVRVFLTGGMSQSTTVIEHLRAVLPGGSTFQRMDPLRSVVAGLATVARSLSRASSIAEEPSVVRGVRIEA